jgi:hypothetical protein
MYSRITFHSNLVMSCGSFCSSRQRSTITVRSFGASSWVSLVMMNAPPAREGPGRGFVLGAHPSRRRGLGPQFSNPHRNTFSLGRGLFRHAPPRGTMPARVALATNRTGRGHVDTGTPYGIYVIYGIEG